MDSSLLFESANIRATSHPKYEDRGGRTFYLLANNDALKGLKLSFKSPINIKHSSIKEGDLPAIVELKNKNEEKNSIEKELVLAKMTVEEFLKRRIAIRQGLVESSEVKPLLLVLQKEIQTTRQGRYGRVAVDLSRAVEAIKSHDSTNSTFVVCPLNISPEELDQFGIKHIENVGHEISLVISKTPSNKIMYNIFDSCGNVKGISDIVALKVKEIEKSIRPAQDIHFNSSRIQGEVDCTFFAINFIIESLKCETIAELERHCRSGDMGTIVKNKTEAMLGGIATPVKQQQNGEKQTDGIDVKQTDLVLSFAHGNVNIPKYVSVGGGFREKILKQGRTNLGNTPPKPIEDLQKRAPLDIKQINTKTRHLGQ